MAAVRSVVVFPLLAVSPCVCGFSVRYLFCFAVLCAVSSFAFISLGKRADCFTFVEFEVRNIQSADTQRPFMLHVYSDVSDFNKNLFLTAKLLKQGALYHKLRKLFSKLNQRRTELIVIKYKDELKIPIATKHFRARILWQF